LNGLIDEQEVVGYALNYFTKEKLWISTIMFKNGGSVQWGFRSEEERTFTLDVIDKEIAAHRSITNGDCIIGELPTR